MAETVSFLLNGKLTNIAVRPDMTVLDMLREELGHKGTKEGCAEGDCGACTILLRREGINGGKANAANSCIMTAAQIDGAEITTVEGLSSEGVLSNLQQAMAENGSSQCGFCTPGIAVALTGLLERNPAPDEAEIHDTLAGNLCRCTGYRPIVEAVQEAAGSSAERASAGQKLPVQNGSITSNGVTAECPASLDDLLAAKEKHPEAILLAGGTDLGVARAAYETDWPSIILTCNVWELRQTSETANSWTFGAAVTWQEVLETISDDLPSLATLIRRFGSTQIRSMGTIGGNIGTASPIGDGPPALIALGASITLASTKGELKTIPLEEFFLDYRKTALPENGVIVSVTVPKPKPGEQFRVYKVSKRYDQDISTVCGAFWFKEEAGHLLDVRVAFGGMAATPKRAPATEAALKGQPLTAANALVASLKIGDDFQPLTDWRGSAGYRLQAAQGLVVRLAHDVEGEIVEVMAL